MDFQDFLLTEAPVHKIDNSMKAPALTTHTSQGLMNHIKTVGSKLVGFIKKNAVDAAHYAQTIYNSSKSGVNQATINTLEGFEPRIQDVIISYAKAKVDMEYYDALMQYATTDEEKKNTLKLQRDAKQEFEIARMKMERLQASDERQKKAADGTADFFGTLFQDSLKGIVTPITSEVGSSLKMSIFSDKPDINNNRSNF